MKKRFLKVLTSVFLFVFANIIRVNADVVDLEKGYVEKGERVSILNENGLMYFAEQVNLGKDYSGKYVTLSRNIDLKDYTWVSIGNGNRSTNDIAFKGTFDGFNHTIKNLNVSGDNSNGCYGLFGIINEATITNVIVESGNISTEVGTTGGIVACMLGNKNTVENNFVGKDVIIRGDTTGGIVGRAYGKENYIYNNTSNATVSGIKKIGGVVGITNNLAILYENKNTGSVTGGSDGTGGILGYGNANTFISASENLGNVNSTKYSGGIVGYATGANGFITNSVNKAEISGPTSTGGILGVLAQSGTWSIQNSKNEGKIIGGDASLCTIGGIAGGLSGIGSVIDSENMAEVKGCTYAGGIVGQILSKGIIKNSKGGTSSVSSNKFTGRIAGSVSGSSTDILSGNTIRLYINDNNGDAYDNIPTVGVIAPLTGTSLLTVEEGTLHGAPYAGTQARIFFQKNAKWDFIADASGKMYKDAGTNPGKDNAVLSNTWDKEVINYGDVTSSVDETTTDNGQRKYMVNGVEKTETVYKTPILWDIEVKKDSSLKTNVSFASKNDSSNKEFDIDKMIQLDNNEVLVDSSNSSAGIMYLFSNNVLATQVKYFIKVDYNTNGGNDIEQKIYYLDSLDADAMLTLEEVPVRDGYIFEGWYYDEAFTQKVESTKISSDTQVYAKWTKEKNENLAPSPKVEEENPQTYDGIIIWAIVSVILAGLICRAVIVRRKMKI